MNRNSSNSMNNVRNAQQIRNRDMQLRMNNRVRRREAKKENKKTKYKEINQGRMEGISSIRSAVKDKMESYKDYCDRLKDAYLKKHSEIEEATNKIKNIKDHMEKITKDVLINLRDVENYNSSNNESLDDDTEQLLKELRKILEDIPETEQENQKLTDLIGIQAMLTQQRENNNKIIEGKINAIKDRLKELGTEIPDISNDNTFSPGEIIPSNRVGFGIQGIKKMNSLPKRLSKKQKKKHSKSSKKRKSVSL